MVTRRDSVNGCAAVPTGTLLQPSRCFIFILILIASFATLPARHSARCSAHARQHPPYRPSGLEQAAGAPGLSLIVCPIRRGVPQVYSMVPGRERSKRLRRSRHLNRRVNLAVPPSFGWRHEVLIANATNVAVVEQLHAARLRFTGALQPRTARSRDRDKVRRNVAISEKIG